MRKKNILITGAPGVGKTTLIQKIAEALKTLHPVGFYTQEIRHGGIRKGFEWISLEGRREILAHMDFKTSYRVGRYNVDIKGFESLLSSIPFFIPTVSIIIIDEIGKMECFSERFREILIRALNSEKWVIATISLKGSGWIEEIKRRKDIRLFEITQRNRDSMVADILKEVEINLTNSTDPLHNESFH